MINSIIIDDEGHCRDTLSILLADYCPEVTILEKCSSAKKGLEAIEVHKPELVFLDIEMPAMNGFELLEQFKEIPFSVIFTTSYDQYAIKAIRFSALDYLLKPIDPKELIAAVHKVITLKAHPTADQFRMLLEQIQQKENNINKIAAAIEKNSLPLKRPLSSSDQRRLAAILFTDIVGYTAMMQKNEADALRVIKRHDTVLKEIVTGHSGEVLNDYGDSSLCIFSSASEAVHCAYEVQRQLQQEPIVPLRIGLHIGEIFFNEGKLMGDGVNIASRIQSLAQANTILFSQEIQDKIRNNPVFQSRSMGFFEFKNVDEPVQVFALANNGLNVPNPAALEGKTKIKKRSWVQRLFSNSK